MLDETEELLAAAQQQESIGNRQEALTLYEHLTEIAPHREEIWLGRIDLLDRLHHSSEALAVCSEAVARFPISSKVWARYGLVLNRLNKSQEALIAYDASIRLDPSNDAAWVGKSSALSSLLRYEEAISASEQALALNPQSSKAWVNKGLALRGLQRKSEATDAYQRAITIDRTNAIAWNNLGNALLEDEKYEEGLAALDSAIALGPIEAYMYNNRAKALFYCERYVEALDSCQRGIQVDDQDSDLWYTLSLVDKQLQLWSEARAAYERALVIAPSDTFLWMRYAELLDEMQLYGEAFTALSHIPVDDPFADDAYDLNSTIQRQLSEVAEGTIPRDPAANITWRQHGITLAKQGKLRKAMAAFATATQFEPREVYTLACGAFVLYQLHQPNDAQMAIEQALKQMPTNAWMLNFLGILLMQQHHNIEAMERFDEGLATKPNNPDLLWNKMIAQYKLNQFTEVVTTMNHYIIAREANLPHERFRPLSTDQLRKLFQYIEHQRWMLRLEQWILSGKYWSNGGIIGMAGPGHTQQYKLVPPWDGAFDQVNDDPQSKIEQV